MATDHAGEIETLIAELGTQIRRDYAPPDVKRDAHPKMHGCVQAEFRVVPDVPAELRHGVFARDPARPLRAWIRFSNAFGVQHDLKMQPRGMAIKLLEVEGDRLPESAGATQDFLLATHDAFFLPTPAGYTAFAKALASVPSGAMAFFVKRRMWRALYQLVRSGAVLARNPLDVTYFSQTPYALGPHAVKLQARPRRSDAFQRALPAAWLFRIKMLLALFVAQGSDRSGDPLIGDDRLDRWLAPRDLLRRALASSLADHEAWFDLLVQTRRDPAAMPIDDATVRWPEARSRFQVVATLRLPRQVFWPEPTMDREFEEATKRMTELGERMSFSPWHGLEAHRPLGSINEARRPVYRELAGLRSRLNTAPLIVPSVQEFDALSRIVQR